MGKILEEIETCIDQLVIESQVEQLKELFGNKRKNSEPIIAIINSILRYPAVQVKKILARIDFTKDYTDSDVDKLILSLKDEIDTAKEESPQRSGDDLVRTYNLGRAHGQGKKVQPGYVGV
jgi:hypothetical protein